MKGHIQSEFENSDELARWINLYSAEEPQQVETKRWGIFQGYVKNRAANRLHSCINLVDTYQNFDVLDVACGGGHYGIAVTKRGGNWSGMDLSFKMLCGARQLLAKHNHSGWLINGDITKLPFSKESFDVIFCVGILSYFPNYNVSKIIHQFPTLLNPGGKLILQTIRLDVITWFRSRLPFWVPRPIRIPGPLYPRKAGRIENMMKDTALFLTKKIEIKKLGILPFQTIYLFEKRG